MLLAVAAPARGRSHVSSSGGDTDDGYAYDMNLYYDGYNDSDLEHHGHSKCGLSIHSSPAAAATHYITLVVFPVFLLQGIVGNLLALPVLVSISRKAWSTVIYLAWLAVTDLIILLIRCGSSWYDEAAKVRLSKKIIDSSDAACKGYYFSFLCVQHMNPWLVVTISVDMMIATRWPKRTYTMCTLKRARYVLLLIGIIIICLDINHFWTYGVPKPGFACMYTEEFSDIFKEWIWPAMDNAVRTILPLVIVSICLFLTTCTYIRRPADQERDLESEMRKYFLELDTLKDFRSICFILCLVFVCVGVFKMSYVLTTFLVSQGYLDLDCVTLVLFDTLDMTFTFLFYAAKIYLYLGLSSMFRARLKKLFLRAGRRLQSLYRIVCPCGHKWTPVPAGDDCRNLPPCHNHPLPDRTNAMRKSNVTLVSSHTTADPVKTSGSKRTSECGSDVKCIGHRSHNSLHASEQRDETSTKV